jgi:transposase-like protein
MPRKQTRLKIRQGFRPRFCPWPGCEDHQRPSKSYGFARFGYYYSKNRKPVPRYRCSRCRRTFSRQSFAATYYLKRPELLVPILSALRFGFTNREIARALGCAHSTVSRLNARVRRLSAGEAGRIQRLDETENSPDDDVAPTDRKALAIPHATTPACRTGEPVEAAKG